MYKLDPKAGTETIGGSLSTFQFNNCILYSRSKNVARTIDLMKENFKLIDRIIHGKKTCIISEATDIPPLKKETSTYMASELPERFKAHAVVSKSLHGVMASEIYLSLQNHGIPAKIFPGEPAARSWVRQFITS